jgi:DNA-3-methyladenine glycosylase II
MDEQMARIISQVGDHALESRGEAFTTLARAIVGQQISVKAADTIWARLIDSCGVACGATLSPGHILEAPQERLRAAGLSQSKTRYLQDLATWFRTTPRLSQTLSTASDESVKAMLIERPGIGPWTADMFLIFTLMRPDVFPVGDLGVLKAMGLLYFDGQPPSRSQAMAHAERWRPYRTAASWLLWRSLDPTPIQY